MPESDEETSKVCVSGVNFHREPHRPDHTPGVPEYRTSPSLRLPLSSPSLSDDPPLPRDTCVHTG